MKKDKKPQRMFKIVDNSLKQIFGEPATSTIYNYLEKRYSLKREDIPNEPEIFTEGLKKFLSDSGASVVLKVISDESSRLKSKLNKNEDKSFFEHLKELERPH